MTQSGSVTVYVEHTSWLSHIRAGGAGPTTPTLVGPKTLLFMVKALWFQCSGRTNNFKWSDQSWAPSAAPAHNYRIFFIRQVSVQLCKAGFHSRSIISPLTGEPPAKCSLGNRRKIDLGVAGADDQYLVKLAALSVQLWVIISNDIFTDQVQKIWSNLCFSDFLMTKFFSDNKQNAGMETLLWVKLVSRN